MSSYYQFMCDACDFYNDINTNICDNCGSNLPGTVNTRRASLQIEKKALEERYNGAINYFINNNLRDKLPFIENELKNKGRALINTQFGFLWEWLFHNNFAYQSYRRQIINGDRVKAFFENDTKRSIVDSILFGSENDIIYSAYSINETGLLSYGDVTVILKTYSIEKRTSALERNSYHFIKYCENKGWTIDQPILPGYMAIWSDICKLFISKSYLSITTDMNFDELALLILNSSGNREMDDFIELHIFGKIISSAVEKIRMPATLVNKFSLKEKVMFKELRSKFKVDVY